MLGRTAGYAWMCLLAVSLLVSAGICYHECDGVQEDAIGCDAFGYLMMAKEIRQAAASRELPNFQIESPQIRLLIDLMRSRNVPPYLWNEMVAPHAHHYFPRTDKVGVQYPPGAGMALAVFREGEALYRLNVVAIGLMVAVGIIGLMIAAPRRAWISAGCIVLALEMGLEILGRIGGLSYSINAVLGPLLLSMVMTFAVLALEADARTERAAPLTALLAGVFLGFGVLTRLSVILLAPGVVVLLTSAPWRKSIVRRILPFAIGLAVVGILPILAEQSQIAGAWYLPTYSVADARPPSFAPVLRNLYYYLGGGPGSEDNPLLVILVIGFAGPMFDRRLRNSGRLSASHLGLSVAVLWSLPTIFFLTHEIAIPYYAVPAIFAAALMIALGILLMELFPASGEVSSEVKRWRRRAGAIALIPGLIAINNIRALAAFSWTPGGQHSYDLQIPAELSDEHNWIWADLMSGSFRYYANKTAFKVSFSDSGTRELVYKFVFNRGERQYLVLDSPIMSEILDEMTRMGAAPQPRGSIGDATYFLIRWPAGGPHPMVASPQPR